MDDLEPRIGFFASHPDFVVIRCTDHRGEVGDRLVHPSRAMPLRFGEAEHRPGRRWFLDAFDFHGLEWRSFAMEDIRSWRPATPDDFAHGGPASP